LFNNKTNQGNRDTFIEGLGKNDETASLFMMLLVVVGVYVFFLRTRNLEDDCANKYTTAFFDAAVTIPENIFTN